MVAVFGLEQMIDRSEQQSQSLGRRWSDLRHPLALVWSNWKRASPQAGIGQTRRAPLGILYLPVVSLAKRALQHEGKVLKKQPVPAWCGRGAD